MTISAPFTAPLPTPTGSPSDDYAVKINAAIQEIRDALNSQITETDLQLQDELPLPGIPVTGFNYAQSAANTSSPGFVRSIYVKNGDWYCTDGAGNEVRLTASGAISVPASGTTYGDQERLVSLKDFSTTSGSTAGSHNGYSILEAGSINTVFIIPVTPRVGERLKGIRIRTNKNSTGTMTLQYATSTDGGAITATGTSATSGTSGLQTLSVTLAAPVTVVSNVIYFVSITCPNVSDRIHQITYTADKIV